MRINMQTKKNEFTKQYKYKKKFLVLRRFPCSLHVLRRSSKIFARIGKSCQVQINFDKHGLIIHFLAVFLVI